MLGPCCGTAMNPLCEKLLRLQDEEKLFACLVVWPCLKITDLTRTENENISKKAHHWSASYSTKPLEPGRAAVSLCSSSTQDLVSESQHQECCGAWLLRHPEFESSTLEREQPFVRKHSHFRHVFEQVTATLHSRCGGAAGPAPALRYSKCEEEDLLLQVSLQYFVVGETTKYWWLAILSHSHMIAKCSEI